jgi:hypothetical protein
MTCPCCGYCSHCGRSNGYYSRPPYWSTPYMYYQGQTTIGLQDSNSLNNRLQQNQNQPISLGGQHSVVGQVKCEH